MKLQLHKTLALMSLVVAFVFCAGLAAAQGTNTGESSVIQGLNAPPVEGKAGSVIDPLGIGYDLSPGSGPPPATLGGYTMTPAPHPGAPACTGMTPPIPTSGGGTIGISPWSGYQACIGSGWATWSHGYTGDVYYTGGATSQTITLPPGTGAVYFYVEPNPFDVHTFQAVAQPGSVSTGTFTAHGDAGAHYVGFYDTGGGSITSITITSTADFAVGEFGWAAGGAATWTLDQDVSYASGTLNLNYTIGTPAPSTWVTLLILTTPSVQVIPLWGVPLPAIAPPVSVPLSFPFPSSGVIGMLTILHDGVTAQAVDLDWVDTSVGGIEFDLSPGTGPPPTTLGHHEMIPVPYPGAPACTKILPPGPLPTPAGGGIDISPWVDQRCIGAGWATWSHKYTGDVYYTGGAKSQTIKLPPGTGAVYFYVEPNPFDVRPFEAVAQPGSVSTGTFTAHGDAGATYVGFYDDTGGSISSIEIKCDSDFASGEFGWGK